MNLELGTDIVSLKRIIRVSERLGFRFFERFLLPSEILLASKQKISPNINDIKTPHSHNNLQDTNQLPHTYTTIPTHEPILAHEPLPAHEPLSPHKPTSAHEPIPTHEFISPYKPLSHRAMIQDSMPQDVGARDIRARKPLIFYAEHAAYYESQVADILERLRMDFSTKAYRMESIAGFWAMKEACAKALGTGISGVLGFHDMCIYKDTRGKPYIALSEQAYKHFQPKSIAISVTHDVEAAFAVCAVSF